MERFRDKRLEAENAKNAPIVRNFLLKRDLLARGDPAHERIKTAVIYLGGGTGGGAEEVGDILAFEELGMRETADCVIAMSAGSVAASYLIAGQAELGPPVLFDNLASTKFVNKLRLSSVLDMQYAESVFRSKKPLDQDRIRNARSHFWIGVTDSQTAEGVYLDTKDPSIDIVTAMCATLSDPAVTKGPREINGVLYADGMIGCTDPIGLAMEQGSTDILVMLPKPLGSYKGTPFFEKLFIRFKLRKYSESFRTASLSRSVRTLSGVIPEYVNIGVMCPPEDALSLGRLSIDARKMRQVTHLAKERLLSIFS